MQSNRLSARTQQSFVIEAPQSPDTAGMLTIFPSNNVPRGWAKTDGSELLISEFPDLYKNLANEDGSRPWDNFTNPATGETTTPSDDQHFCLPNLSGLFLRANQDGTLEVGSSQDDTTATNSLKIGSIAHTHSINHDHGTANTANADAFSGSTSTGENYPTLRVGDDLNRTAAEIYDGDSLSGGLCRNRYSSIMKGTHYHTFNMPSFSGTSGSMSANPSPTISGDSETRPKNSSSSVYYQAIQ